MAGRVGYLHYIIGSTVVFAVASVGCAATPLASLETVQAEAMIQLAHKGRKPMKLGIIGTGNVVNAIALAAVTRGSAREIVLVNRTSKTAEAVATDLRYGTPLSPKVDITHGDYRALAGAGVVLITSGVNEKTGGTPAGER